MVILDGRPISSSLARDKGIHTTNGSRFLYRPDRGHLLGYSSRHNALFERRLGEMGKEERAVLLPAWPEHLFLWLRIRNNRTWHDSVPIWKRNVLRLYGVSVDTLPEDCAEIVLQNGARHD